jgi:hypothetical protein
MSGSTESRQARLKSAFGFDCKCKLCSSFLTKIRASDLRRRRIEVFDGLIGDKARVMMTPDRSLQDCHSLLHTLKLEFTGCAAPLLARLYYDAFQISITHGDEARAIAFAKRALRARISCEGEDSPEAKMMSSLVENPNQYPGYNISTKWKTAKGAAPKGLRADDFEKWLWRQEK